MMPIYDYDPFPVQLGYLKDGQRVKLPLNSDTPRTPPNKQHGACMGVDSLKKATLGLDISRHFFHLTSDIGSVGASESLKLLYM